MNLDLKERKNIIVAVVVIAITLFFSKKIWDKQQSKIVGIKNSIKNYERMIDMAGDINQLSKEVEKFGEFSWPTRESVAIMGKVNELATKYEVEITTFDPAGRKDATNFLTISMNMNIEADYFSLIRFVSALEKLEHLTKITGLRISVVPDSGSQDSGPITKAFVSLDAYIF